jgi:hypothetical protein
LSPQESIKKKFPVKKRVAKTIKVHKITIKCLVYVYTHVYFTKSRLPEQILKNLEKSTREYKLCFILGAKSKKLVFNY